MERTAASAPLWLRKSICERAASTGQHRQMDDENKQLKHEEFVKYYNSLPPMRTFKMPPPRHRPKPPSSRPPPPRAQSIPERVLNVVSSVPVGLWRFGQSIVSTTSGAVTYATSSISQGLSSNPI